MKVGQDDIDALWRTVWGEARGEVLAGKLAVAHVILNRVRLRSWMGRTVAGVCRKPRQFSCWNEGDPNRAKILAVEPGHRVFDTCLRIARRAVSGCIDDMTKGATHYHTKHVTPPWSRGKPVSFELGRHEFYNNIE